MYSKKMRIGTFYFSSTPSLMEGMILTGPYLLNCDSYRSLIITQSMEGRISTGPYHLDCNSYRSQISQLGHVAAAWKRSHHGVFPWPQNTKTIGRMKCHCFLWPIQRDPSSETQGQIQGARESLNGWKNIYGMKKSKERREEPLGTMS